MGNCKYCCMCGGHPDVRYIPTLDEFYCSECVVIIVNDILQDADLIDDCDCRVFFDDKKLRLI